MAKTTAGGFDQKGVDKQRNSAIGHVHGKKVPILKCDFLDSVDNPQENGWKGNDVRRLK